MYGKWWTKLIKDNANQTTAEPSGVSSIEAHYLGAMLSGSQSAPCKQSFAGNTIPRTKNVFSKRFRKA